jgi:hypothetical protein
VKTGGKGVIEGLPILLVAAKFQINFINEEDQACSSSWTGTRNTGMLVVPPH